MKPATLREFVIAACCHWIGGGCVFAKDGKCAVMKRARCKFFERAVLLLADRAEGGDYLTAKAEYARLVGDLKQPDVRYCDCGNPMRPRARMCDACREKQRRKTHRAANRRRRGLGDNS